ncbi:MAG TPA: thymidine phosphorylase [Spirochaetia bacterium]|nr:thymidine phosphorylase [Spirochaetia bacterium]
MRAVDLIMKKRDALGLEGEEIEFLVQGFSRGEIPDYQMSALLMAIVLRGMNAQETARLTEAMIRSGDVLDLSGVPGPLVDKHSTGGVGDKISLILAPVAAACGIRVPMMSGRSLGHTGGTLDKLESIPGYRTDLSPERFRQGLSEIGFAMIGQSEKVVPADRRMYALRDVTGTVESVPLITASIMSKKFAEGAEALVFDVKCGSGAFMKDREQARALATSLVSTGKGLGRKVVAVITDMDQPLGRTVGNFPEVEESIDCLRGRGPADIIELTCRLVGWMLVLGGKAASPADGQSQARKRLADGSAWNLFLKNVEFQGGRTDCLLNPEKGPHGRIVQPLLAPSSGVVGRIDAFKVGLASVVLGAGRSRKEDPVLPGVGITICKPAGEVVAQGDELCLVRGESEPQVREALQLLARAWQIADKEPPSRPMILEEITQE